MRKRLSLSATGDWEYKYCACPVEADGEELPPIALFEKHEDALLFVEVRNATVDTGSAQNDE